MRYDPSFLAFLRQYSPADVVTAPPVIAEIEYGIRRLARNTRKRKLLEEQRDRILSILKILPWNAASAEHYGEIKAGLEKSGAIIDDFDIAIAAIATSHKHAVITANLAHFRLIENLESSHWRDFAG